MTVHLQCDYCGEAIEDDGDRVGHVTIDAHGIEEVSDSLGRYQQILGEHVGDYHATPERPCYEQMRDLMLDVREAAAASALENIPTATAQKVTRLRSKHLKGEQS